MIAWFLFSLIPALVSEPNGNRAIGTLVPVYFFAAVGMIILVNLLARFAGKYQNVARITMLTYLTGVTLAVSYVSYLGPARRQPKGFYPETFTASRYLATRQKDYDLYLTDNFPREILTFMLYTGGDPFKANYTWFDKKESFLAVTPHPKKGVLFVMLPYQKNIDFAKQLAARYPGSNQFTLFYEIGINQQDAAVIIEVPPAN